MIEEEAEATGSWPALPIEGTTPASWHLRPYAKLVYWTPRSEWCPTPATGRRFQSAMLSASRTNVVSKSPLIAQPTMRREYRSRITAT